MPPSEASKFMPSVTNIPSAPMIGDTKSWTALAMKRMIAYAVDNGFQKIAWTTGEQQNARYDLSKQVKEVSYLPYDDGTYEVGVVLPNGQEFNAAGGKKTLAQIEEILGKDIARKIQNEEGDVELGGNLAWDKATKPESAGKLLDNIFGTEMASLMSLDHVDAGMLPMLKHNQVREFVISLLPVNVVDMLINSKIAPKDVFSNPSMVFSGLTINSRASVADGILSAVREAGTSIRAELKGIKSTGSDVTLLPALKASDLSTREVAGLLDSKRLFHGGTNARDEQGFTPARTGAEPSDFNKGRNANELSSAELAKLLNSHADILQHKGIITQQIVIPTLTIKGDNLKAEATGMKRFYDQIVPQVANDILRKIGDGKVENVNFAEKEKDKGNGWISTGEDVTGRPATVQQGFTITPELRAKVQGEGLPLFQKARGSFNPETFTISLLKGADLSTTFHELAHFFFESDIADASELVQKATLTEGEQKVADDVHILLKFYGFTGDLNDQLRGWHSMNFAQQRELHETFAESFEK
jgi:hypothetical protein